MVLILEYLQLLRVFIHYESVNELHGGHMKLEVKVVNFELHHSI